MTSPSTQHLTNFGERVLEVPQLKLQVLSGDSRGRAVSLVGECLRIGKSRDNDLVLGDSTVSRVHCEVRRDRRGYLLRDLGSTNGTLLDGVEVREVYLRPGVVLTVGKVELKVHTLAERISLKPSERQRFGRCVAKSRSMREIFGLLERLAPSDATVLLRGETGTGKDMLAKAIHEASPRNAAPFVVVNCGAVSGALVESELFGHEKGAFSGAHELRRGAFEVAAGGTIFLNEIGELPLDLQPKLLRVLEQRAFRRVGGTQETRVDLRVIAASKRDLRREVERGKFRADLYFRLAVVPIDVPPLRQRREDVPLLVRELLNDWASKQGLSAPVIGKETIDSLCAHDWPGNIRELRNVLARAALEANAEPIRLGHLPLIASAEPPRVSETFGEDAPASAAFDPALSYRECKALFEEDFERRYVAWLLEAHSGNISAASRAAGMDRKYLHKLAKRHGLHPSDRRS